MALKFGSPAWRKKYMKKGKRKNAAKRKTSGSSRNHKTKAAYKKKKRASAVRSNPPRTWTKVKALRVIRKNGIDIVEFKK